MEHALRDNSEYDMEPFVVTLLYKTQYNLAHHLPHPLQFHTYVRYFTCEK